MKNMKELNSIEIQSLKERLDDFARLPSGEWNFDVDVFSEKLINEVSAPTLRLLIKYIEKFYVATLQRGEEITADCEELNGKLVRKLYHFGEWLNESAIKFRTPSKDAEFVTMEDGRTGIIEPSEFKLGMAVAYSDVKRKWDDSYEEEE